ncbi:conserved hypothetical protein, membrane [methanotrophic bacterial endosymbiont of Bathymodiolus sp.]|nr:conserved hypothetical protein, membrane [methanotrophic bacterial endosymbiont of Bathymodiolus sp.]
MAQAIYPGAARAARLLLYLILLQVGFTMPLLLPVTRCALTAPFHPYPAPETSFQGLGGLFSAALSVGLCLPDVIWYLALWSPDFPLYYSFPGNKATA